MCDSGITVKLAQLSGLANFPPPRLLIGLHTVFKTLHNCCPAGALWAFQKEGRDKCDLSLLLGGSLVSASQGEEEH